MPRNTFLQNGISMPDRRRLVGSDGAFTFSFALGPTDAEPADSWLAIASDNSVTLTIGAAGVGPGALKSLAEILAEELMVDPLRVLLVQVAPMLAADAPVVSPVDAAGCARTGSHAWKLRHAGATVRELFVRAAMEQTGDAERASFSVGDGAIAHTGGVQFTYGRLIRGVKRLAAARGTPAPPDPPTPSPTRVASSRMDRDQRLPGMVFAALLHGPSDGSTLASTPALPSGAIALVPLRDVGDPAGDSTALAVVAATTWDAIRLSRSLSPAWHIPENAAAAHDPREHSALPGEQPHFEVSNCAVDYVAGIRCDVHAPLPSCRSALAVAMSLTGLREDQVTLHTTPLEDGRARTADVGFIAHAVQLGMALGRPVQVFQAREHGVAQAG